MALPSRFWQEVVSLAPKPPQDLSFTLPAIIMEVEFTSFLVYVEIWSSVDIVPEPCHPYDPRSHDEFREYKP